MQHRTQRNSALRTFRQNQPHLMVKIEPYNRELAGDPPTAFATDAEIEIADRLRRKLEARYLAGSEASPPLSAAPVNDDEEGPL